MTAPETKILTQIRCFVAIEENFVMNRMQITTVLLLVAFLVFACSKRSTNRPREKEIEALKLLGVNTDTFYKDAEGMSALKGTLGSEMILYCQQNQTRETPCHQQIGIDQLRTILGSEDSTESGEFKETGPLLQSVTFKATLYNFGWLSFAVRSAGGKVVLVKADFKKLKENKP